MLPKLVAVRSFKIGNNVYFCNLWYIMQFVNITDMVLTKGDRLYFLFDVIGGL